MSKILTPQELLKLINEAKTKISDYFSELLNNNSADNNKKASMLASWVLTYIKYIKSEKTFNPKSLINYRKGRIVFVDFGFRVGNEYGGRHYAIVIDNKNAKISGVLTVIPLSSLKPNFVESKYEFQLKTGLYQLAADKVNNEALAIKEKMEKLNEEREIKLSQYENGEITLEEYKNFENYKNKKVKEWNVDVAIMLKHLKQLNSLKTDTVVDVGQVTTISKMRIINPKSNKDLLSGINICEEDVSKLKSYLKSLYLF